MRFLLVAAFFVHGVGQLLPGNVFINAVSYFKIRFCGTPFHLNFENWFGVIYTVMEVVGLLLMLRYNEMVKQRARILVGLAIVFLVFAGSALLVFWTNLNGVAMFYLTMISVSVISFSSSISQSGFISLASNYPSECMQSMTTGQSVAGLIVSVVNFVTVASDNVMLPHCIDSNIVDRDAECASYKIDKGTAAYFSIAAFTILTSMFGYLILTSYKDNLYYALNSNKSDLAHGDIVHVDQDVSIKSAFHFVQASCLNIFTIFFMTLSMYPSTTSRIISLYVCSAGASRWQTDLFTPLTFVLFNLSNVIGCFSAASMQFITDKMLLPLAFIRLMFIPLLLFCAISDSKLPVLFRSDVWPILFIVLIGISNGYIQSRCFMTLSKYCPPHYADLAGTIMMLSLVLGLLMGSSFSFLVLFISTGNIS